MKSKQSAIPSSAPVRAFNEGRPKAFSQKRSRLTCECTACEMKPPLA